MERLIYRFCHYATRFYSFFLLFIFNIYMQPYTYDKDKTYDSILVIVNWLIKMVHYKPVKVTIDTLTLIEIIIKTIVQYHSFPDSIVTDWGSDFTSKFLLLLYYFFKIE